MAGTDRAPCAWETSVWLVMPRPVHVITIHEYIHASTRETAARVCVPTRPRKARVVSHGASSQAARAVAGKARRAHARTSRGMRRWRSVGRSTTGRRRPPSSGTGRVGRSTTGRRPSWPSCMEPIVGRWWWRADWNKTSNPSLACPARALAYARPLFSNLCRLRLTPSSRQIRRGARAVRDTGERGKNGGARRRTFCAGSSSDGLGLCGAPRPRPPAPRDCHGLGRLARPSPGHRGELTEKGESPTLRPDSLTSLLSPSFPLSRSSARRRSPRGG
jgi:hypothetical protein